MVQGINWDDARGADLLEEGTYPAEVAATKYTQPDGGGNPFFNVRFILSGENEGRSAFRKFYLTEKSLVFLKRFLVTCGVEAHQLSGPMDMATVTELVAETKGAPVTLVVKHRPYTDRQGDEQISADVDVRPPGYEPSGSATSWR